MPRTEGNCGPVVVATTGIDLPDASRIDFAAIRARVAEQTWARREVLAVVAAGPVVCDVCGVRVAAEYTARTGQRRHKSCQAQASTAGPAAVREVA
ncbi:MAG TPA: hypothetical protein VFP72_19235 [Kineosporiaceae bacterium]|nr:hypothetical protein [Kineosporiaceae bacterium]